MVYGFRCNVPHVVRKKNFSLVVHFTQYDTQKPSPYPNPKVPAPCRAGRGLRVFDPRVGPFPFPPSGVQEQEQECAFCSTFRALPRLLVRRHDPRLWSTPSLDGQAHHPSDKVN